MNKQQTIELMNGYKLPADKFKLVIEIDRLEKMDDEKRRMTGTLNGEVCEKINTLKMLFQPAEL
jgi:2-keto-4-pentenoate hydratase/2-oxohepta-3-ene-1,7-dioic acid hydratase in catechol pathway